MCVPDQILSLEDPPKYNDVGTSYSQTGGGCKPCRVGEAARLALAISCALQRCCSAKLLRDADGKAEKEATHGISVAVRNSERCTTRTGEAPNHDRLKAVTSQRQRRSAASSRRTRSGFGGFVLFISGNRACASARVCAAPASTRSSQHRARCFAVAFSADCTAAPAARPKSRNGHKQASTCMSRTQLF